jgi:hypothetical protein
MRSIHDIVDLINAEFTFKDSVIYCIAQTVARTNERGEDEKVPFMPQKGNNGVYVGIDDKYGIILYHKLVNLTSRTDPKRGMGREPFYVNTYSLSMIVFLNRKRVTLFSDELFNSIQDQFPAQLRLQPYAGINLSINSVILNDTEVWAREYSSEYRLTAEENLIQVNYTVEVAFLKGCFVNC